MNNNKLKATIFRIVRLNKILEIDLRPIFERVRLMVTNTRKVQIDGVATFGIKLSSFCW